MKADPAVLTARPMRISFDIDETLVCRHTDVPNEVGRLPLFLHRRLAEPLRRGTRTLIQQLRQQGWHIWIYTSSARTKFHIWLWLFLYGIRVDGIINEQKHRLELADRRFSRLPSKYPPAFGIDLHVDDSEGVRMEGEEHNFQVAVVRPEDENWTQRVLDAASRCRANQPSIGTAPPITKPL
ncbi:MAG: hypothetical protein JWR26_618 [Pedosphaera sp.]|nr:hypothetical protein [Pedosphaera sp.]